MSDSLKNNSLYTPEALASEAQTSSCTGFVLFNDICDEKGKGIPYCFVEGYDEGYYSPIVQIRCGKRPAFVICGGKEGVIESYRIFSDRPEYSDYMMLYFVDRDYDDNSELPREDVCVTEGYSVENYYCSEECIKSFLSTICGMNHERKDEIRNTIDLYQQLSQKFYEATLPFCCWYANLRKSFHRNPISDDYKPSFPRDLVKLDYKTGITVNDYTLEDLNIRYGLEDPVREDEFESKKATIKDLKDIRGKFVIQFVNFFLQYIRLKAEKPGGTVRNKFGFEENQKTILTRLSGCADKPESLISYISARTQLLEHQASV